MEDVAAHHHSIEGRFSKKCRSGRLESVGDKGFKGDFGIPNCFQRILTNWVGCNGAGQIWSTLIGTEGVMWFVAVSIDG